VGYRHEIGMTLSRSSFIAERLPLQQNSERWTGGVKISSSSADFGNSIGPEVSRWCSRASRRRDMISKICAHIPLSFRKSVHTA
jgi:hypothetical protein